MYTYTYLFIYIYIKSLCPYRSTLHIYIYIYFFTHIRYTSIMLTTELFVCVCVCVCMCVCMYVCMYVWFVYIHRLPARGFKTWGFAHEVFLPTSIQPFVLFVSPSPLFYFLFTQFDALKKYCLYNALCLV